MLNTLKHHSTFQVLWCHRHELNAFYYIITKKVIESTFNSISFLIGLLWERLLKVPTDYLLAISQHAIQQPKQQVADEIVHT